MSPQKEEQQEDEYDMGSVPDLKLKVKYTELICLDK